MSSFLEEWVPKISTAFCVFCIIWIIADTYMVGIGYGGFTATNLQRVQQRAGPITGIVMSINVIRLYVRRLRSTDSSLRTKGIMYFVGAIVTAIIGLGFGRFSEAFAFQQIALSRVVGEACSSGWIAITYVSLIVRGYMVRTKEGILMAFVGMAELFAQGGIGNLFLPQYADLGIWIMRYPGVGANNAMWFTTYIALLSVVGRVIIGKQKLRATAR